MATREGVEQVPARGGEKQQASEAFKARRDTSGRCSEDEFGRYGYVEETRYTGGLYVGCTVYARRDVIQESYWRIRAVIFESVEAVERRAVSGSCGVVQVLGDKGV